MDSNISVRELARQAAEPALAEQATGCRGSGDYRKWAKAQGYTHLEVWDWTSSAGDWSFIVSRDGAEWFMMTQTNNYPRPGFTYKVHTEHSYFGSKDSVLAEGAKHNV